MHRLLVLLTISCALALRPAPAAAAPTELRFLAYFAETLRDTMRGIVDEFNASHPDLVVHYEFVPIEGLKRQLLVLASKPDGGCGLDLAQAA